MEFWSFVSFLVRSLNSPHKLKTNCEEWPVKAEHSQRWIGTTLSLQKCGSSSWPQSTAIKYTHLCLINQYFKKFLIALPIIPGSSHFILSLFSLHLIVPLVTQVNFKYMVSLKKSNFHHLLKIPPLWSDQSTISPCTRLHVEFLNVFLAQCWFGVNSVTATYCRAK